MENLNNESKRLLYQSKYLALKKHCEEIQQVGLYFTLSNLILIADSNFKVRELVNWVLLALEALYFILYQSNAHDICPFFI